MNELFSLAGRNAVVTGASRGIGRAIALGYARAGANLALVGRDASRLGPVVDEIAALGRQVAPIVADVSIASDVARLAVEAEQALGPIDVLVNNAGGSPIYRRLEATSDEDWELVVGLNLDGTFRCCREFGRQMIARRSGRIVNLVSIGARVGLPRLAAYCAAKAGVEGLTRALAIEWAQYGVLVNALGPAFVETDLTRGLRENERLRAGLLAQTPLERFAQPDEIVGAAVFLASPAASYLTGQTIYVDGGWTAR
ncbi:MAG: SDR family NAD(P)-dependent oxidoreductase [Chloroflexota bacterium]